MEKIRQQIINIINRSSRILVMPSMPVDGDSLGSALSMYLALKKLGKEVTVVCADPVPETYQFLPTTKIINNEFEATNDFIVTLDCKKSKIKTIKTKLETDKVNIIITADKGQFSADDVSFHHGPSKYDLIITVDTADLIQLGRFYEDNPELFTSIPVINIDHHPSNTNFGKINMIDIMASSTTEILIPLIEYMEKETDTELMDEDIATLLLAGIITDTGSFQNANTTPKSFAMSAQLIRYGARQQEIIQHVFKTKHLSTLKLWGRILSKIKIDEAHRMVWSSISKKDFEDTASNPEETSGIIDELMTNAPGAEVVILLKQRSDDLLSASIRTTTAAVDASEIAALFGGGGHVQAAGFKMEITDFDTAVKQVIEKIRQHQAAKGLEYTTTIPASPEISSDTPSEDKSVSEKTTVPEKPKKKGKEVTKTTKVKPKESEEKEEETFTDVITRKKAQSGEETSLEPGITYKFEE